MSTQRNDTTHRDDNEKLRAIMAQRFCEIAKCDLPSTSFLAPDDSERIRKSFFAVISANSRNVSKLFVTRRQVGLVHATMSWLGRRYGNSEVFLFHCYDDRVGAIRSNVATLAAHFVELWELVREDFIFTDKDVSLGLLLELNFFDWNRRSLSTGIFEMTVVGAELPVDDPDMKGHDVAQLGRIPEIY